MIFPRNKTYRRWSGRSISVLSRITSVFSLSNSVSTRWMCERAHMSICVCYSDRNENCGHTSIKQIWKRHSYARALYRFAEGFMGIPGGERPSCHNHSFQLHVDRVCPAFKIWYSFPTEINSSLPIKHKHIRSLMHHLHVQYHLWYRQGRCSNEHVRAFTSAR